MHSLNTALPALSGLAALLTLASNAHADLITWSQPRDTTAIAEVSTVGSLVAARNFAGAAASAVTVNGVNFTALVPNEWDSGGSTLMATSSTGDADFDQLLTTARTPFGTPSGNPSGFGAVRLDTLGSLQIGRTYAIQVWYCDQRSGLTRDRVMTLSSATGAVTTLGGIANNLGAVTQGSLSGGLEADPNNLNGATDTVFGQFCEGTFTRTTGDELWFLVEGTHPSPGTSLRPHVNALQIRDVTGANIGSNYCMAASNSSGAVATMVASGSAVASQNSLSLTVRDMPTSAFGFFLTSRNQGFAMNAGGSQGNLCLAGAIGRFVGPGQIQNSGANGQITLALNLTQHPTPTGFVSVVAGETWNFSAWFRDTVGGLATSNFADGVELVFL